MNNTTVMEQQPVVVLGAGFGGLRAALSLERGLRKVGLAKHYRVILVDQHRYHTYTPLLMGVATALRETFGERKEMAAFDVAEVLRGTSITFVNDRITDIDPTKRLVAFLHHPPVLYSILVVALGGVTNYFDIPGLVEHSIALKTLGDAQMLAMRLHTYAEDGVRVRIVVGGGGSTGVGLAGSLAELRDTLHRQFPRFDMELTIIEGQPSVLPGFTSLIIEKVAAMLMRRRVRLMTGKQITHTDAQQITLHDGAAVPYDIFVWTGGVKSSPLIEQLSMQIEHGRAAVDSTMTCVPLTPNLSLESTVYAIGDIVCFHDSRTDGAVPGVARAALDEAQVVSHNIVERLKAQHVPSYIPKLRSYKPRSYAFIIPMGNTDAIAHIGEFTFTGFVARSLKWFAELNYIIALLPLRHALRMWWRSRKMAA